MDELDTLSLKTRHTIKASTAPETTVDTTRKWQSID